MREKALQSTVVEVVAQTRMIGSPYYQINPSGRVPYFIREDGVGMEGPALICDHLDHLDNDPMFAYSDNIDRWEFLRLAEHARSLVEGALVWIRELLRPQQDRSQKIIEHEMERCRRLLVLWDGEIDHPLMHGPLNYPQLALACALNLEVWNPSFAWRAEHPELSKWLDERLDRPSFKVTSAPGSQSLD